jgi:hypothetical protein
MGFVCIFSINILIKIQFFYVKDMRKRNHQHSNYRYIFRNDLKVMQLLFYMGFLFKDDGSIAAVNALSNLYGTQYEHGNIAEAICKYN